MRFFSVVGWVALLVALVAGLVGYSALRREQMELRDGWSLSPVVVASQDIPAGAVIDFSMVQQRRVPVQFVTDSVVKPKAVNEIMGEKTQVPMLKGDFVLRSHFERSAAAPATPCPEPAAVTPIEGQMTP